MSTKSDKVIVWGFFGIIGVYAVGLLIAAVYIKSKPQHEVEQTRLGVQLSLAYQKYRIDKDAWPQTVYEVAENFKSEIPNMIEKVDKAEDTWGMKVRLEEQPKPHLFVVFDKPEARTLEYPISPRTEKN